MLDFDHIDHEGLSQASIDRFLKTLRRQGLAMHSILLFRNNRLCFERYWGPYDKDTPHRMYSVTKTFVSAAIGCLVGEGKLNIDDPIIKFFPDKLPPVVPRELKEQTVRHMLTMSTCFEGMYWFESSDPDRTKYYFNYKPVRPSGTVFEYDSTGSYILGVLVERVSGKPLLQYLREKVLDKLGGFENCELLETADGMPWGDSAMICTPRALARLSQCLMDEGEWNGEQLIDRDYVKAATACQVDNNLNGRFAHNHYGYGFQIWRTERNGFTMDGMGCQYALCVPEKRFMFVCTGDNLTNDFAAEKLLRAVFEELVDPLYGDEPEPVIPEGTDGLPVGRGETDVPFAKEIDGAWFKSEPNPMGITRFSLSFDGEGGGVFRYTNAQGDKELPFGLGHNVMTQFPELGYSNLRGNVHELTDFKYRCAVSAGWVEKQKLQILVQILDRYFGGLCITLGFRDGDVVGVKMVKSGEDFFQTYEGWMGAYRQV